MYYAAITLPDIQKSYCSLYVVFNFRNYQKACSHTYHDRYADKKHLKSPINLRNTMNFQPDMFFIH